MKHTVTPFGNPLLHRGERHEPLRSSKEVMEEFGYKGNSSLVYAIETKKFPEPDKVLVGFNGFKKLYWKLSTIQKEKQRRAQCR